MVLQNGRVPEAASNVMRNLKRVGHQHRLKQQWPRTSASNPGPPGQRQVLIGALYDEWAEPNTSRT